MKFDGSRSTTYNRTKKPFATGYWSGDTYKGYKKAIICEKVEF